MLGNTLGMLELLLFYYLQQPHANNANDNNYRVCDRGFMADCAEKMRVARKASQQLTALTFARAEILSPLVDVCAALHLR